MQPRFLDALRALNLGRRPAFSPHIDAGTDQFPAEQAVWSNGSRLGVLKPCVLFVVLPLLCS